jgi:hypothetical protein
MGAHLLDRIGLRRVPDAVAERLAKSAADLDATWTACAPTDAHHESW